MLRVADERVCEVIGSWLGKQRIVIFLGSQNRDSIPIVKMEVAPSC